MISKFKIGNAQTIGCRAVQSNYFATDQKDNGVLAVLADGTIDSVNGMRAAVIACEITKANFSLDPSQEKSFVLCRETLRSKIYLGKTPRVSLLSVWLEADRMSFKQVGNLKLYYMKNGNLVPVPEREGTMNIESGSSITLCSKGVFDTLNEVEISSVLLTKRHPYDKAQKIIEMVQRKNRRLQDNATVVIIQNW